MISIKPHRLFKYHIQNKILPVNENINKYQHIAHTKPEDSI